MLKNVSYCNNQLRDYSSLFSRNKVKSWLQDDFSSIMSKIERYDMNWMNLTKASYMDYLKHVYRILESNYPNEYIYKNSFLNESLIDEVGKSDSVVFNEFRVGDSIADLVMFNGVSKVFEIKSELDSDRRLGLQIENYKKAFNEIYLIVPESKLSSYLVYDKEIGIITFNSKETKKLTLRRKSIYNPEIDTNTIINILHTKEYKNIVKLHYGVLPEMTSFNQYDICKGLICEIPTDILNKLFIEQMKNRKSQKGLSNRNYKELNQLSLALKMTDKERKNLIFKLKSPLKEL